MPVILVRSITPKRAVGINPAWFRTEVERELQAMGTIASNELKKPTRQWNHPPEMDKRFSREPNRFTMTVQPMGPHAQKYNWIDFGVDPHIIHAKPGKMMIFQPGYHASTIPNRLWSRKARRFGKTVAAKQVTHYITPRNFSDQVYKIVNPIFRRNMENLIRRGLRRGA